MRTADFDYHLPEERIAQQPLAERSASRLLVLGSAGLLDQQMRDFPQHLRAEDLVVFNDTRVVKARLHGVKEGSGGRVEVLIERLHSPHQALAMLRASKTPPPGQRLLLGQGASAALVEVQGREEEFFRLHSERPWAEVLEEHGEVPLPPYISREADAEDQSRYQSLLAREDGAVAAPTASLHFDEALLAAVRDRVAEVATVTLHVGAGTFQPVRVEEISGHQMHAERFQISPALVEAVQRCRQRGGRVVAIGTTVVRALESAAQSGDLQAGAGDSRLFITPGYRFQVVDALLTNFHLPRSTLLMLVSAMAGVEPMRAAYAHAIAAEYRFFSYGDAMFIPALAQP